LAHVARRPRAARPRVPDLLCAYGGASARPPLLACEPRARATLRALPFTTPRDAVVMLRRGHVRLVVDGDVHGFHAAKRHAARRLHSFLATARESARLFGQTCGVQFLPCLRLNACRGSLDAMRWCALQCRLRPARLTRRSQAAFFCVKQNEMERGGGAILQLETNGRRCDVRHVRRRCGALATVYVR